MSPFFRANGKIIFVYVGLAIMVTLRTFDGGLRAGNSTAFAEISGWVFLAVGFSFAKHLDSRFELLIRRLVQRGAISFGQNDPEELIRSSQRMATVWERIGWVVFPMGVGLVYFKVLDTVPANFWLKFGLELIAASLTGGYAGRLIGYGFLGRCLRQHRVKICVSPTHPDGAGGLRVVGDHFLYQAVMILLPVIFFAFWFVAGSVWDDPPNSISIGRWKWEFGILFLLMLVIEIAAFVVPLVYFHGEMRQRIATYICEADELGNEVIKIKAAALKETDVIEIESIKARCGVLEEEIRALENVPTWPLNAGIRRRFAWWNILVFTLPLVAEQREVSTALKSTFAPFLEPSKSIPCPAPPSSDSSSS